MVADGGVVIAATRKCPTCGHDVDAESDHCQCRERNGDKRDWCQCKVPLLPIRSESDEFVGPLQSPALRRFAQTFRVRAR